MTGADRSEAWRTLECSTPASSDGMSGMWTCRRPDGGIHRLGGARGEDDLARPSCPTGRPPALALASSAWRAARPSAWTRPGSAARCSFAFEPVTMAFTTSGRGGEVDAWSR